MLLHSRYLSVNVFTLVGLALAMSAEIAFAQYPTVDSVAHKPYTETLDRDGAKATFDMIAIPGGVFLMGSPAAEKGRKDNEGPVHPVQVKPFWIGKCEVTWGEYDLFWEKKPDEKPAATPADKFADAITRPSKAN